MTQKTDRSLFDKIVRQNVMSTPVSENLPILNHIATEWGLNLNRKRDWDTAVRILINSVKYN
jgi:hypothetical protein